MTAIANSSASGDKAVRIEALVMRAFSEESPFNMPSPFPKHRKLPEKVKESSYTITRKASVQLNSPQIAPPLIFFFSPHSNEELNATPV